MLHLWVTWPKLVSEVSAALSQMQSPKIWLEMKKNPSNCASVKNHFNPKPKRVEPKYFCRRKRLHSAQRPLKPCRRQIYPEMGTTTNDPPRVRYKYHRSKLQDAFCHTADLHLRLIRFWQHLFLTRNLSCHLSWYMNLRRDPKSVKKQAKNFSRVLDM